MSNYGMFLVTITPPGGGQTVSLWLDREAGDEDRCLSLALARLRHVITRLAGKDAPQAIVYNQPYSD